ncbi:DNA polymerase I [Anderseniella sp. Alg231-50]|uniref:DNA polymerase I n=1 Tax=Anderseniella sp. Alg231-50 TaxID=1922226 RepID=UPI000D55CCB4
MSTAASRPIQPGDHLYLIDASGYIFRAYHALPPLTRKSDGLPVGAVQGFCNMLYKLLQQMSADDKPTHIAAIFDKSSKSFRNDIYPDYKAHRPPAPEDLVPQFGLIRQATEAFNVACIEQENYEADDLIATYATQAAAAGATVRIVSSDKDLMQLVTDQVMLLDTMKDKAIGRDEVIEKFGVPPEKVVEVQALAGDSVDNVPGVPGIGVKTGAQLIEEYGDLESLLARAGEIKQPKRREKLIEFADQARVSKELVILKTDVDVDHPIEDFGVIEPEAKSLIGFLKALDFNTLIRRVSGDFEASAADIEPIEVTFTGWPPEGADVDELGAPATGDAGDAPAGDASDAATGGDAAAVMADRMRNLPPPDHAAYERVTTRDRLEAWVQMIQKAGLVAVDTETTSLDNMQASLCGISFSVEPGKACYIPTGHRASDGLDFGGGDLEQLSEAEVIGAVKEVLEHPGILKIGQNLKYDLTVFQRLGISVAPIDDTMLLSYALDSGVNGHGMDELADVHLGLKPIKFKDVAGTGKSQVTFDLVPLDQATSYAAEDADITLRLWNVLKPRLASEHRATVYETLERPLVPVLAAMEREGILVDRTVLARLSAEFSKDAEVLEKQVHELAGETFNLGSPKQIGEILFGKLGLQGGKKTATGAWSTDSQVMEDLAGDGVELARKLLDWRQLTKLRSTYTDALTGHINPETGRVHTSYSLASTSTGRLSSTDPNLQNIPVRTAEGRQIRTAFVAAPGHKLVSADYSQIELRVLAHIAGIDQLKKAFADGLDIHAMTASEMFDTPVEGMDPSIRRKAKAINFGIIYGISAFGLANQLAIPREEAGRYIKTYFERFPGIKDYMEHTKAFCRTNGYVETVFGRRMHFPRIKSPNPSERAFQERASINAPIQGSAADIIRRAMIRMPQALTDAGLNARMLLQVHDELIFEVPDAEADATIKVASEVMVAAPLPTVSFSVPIQVDARAADNWDEAH